MSDEFDTLFHELQAAYDQSSEDDVSVYIDGLPIPRSYLGYHREGERIVFTVHQDAVWILQHMMAKRRGAPGQEDAGQLDYARGMAYAGVEKLLSDGVSVADVAIAFGEAAIKVLKIHYDLDAARKLLTALSRTLSRSTDEHTPDDDERIR